MCGIKWTMFQGHLDAFFWALTISWSRLLARVWSGPKSKVAWVSSISLNRGSIGRVMVAINSSSERLSRVDWELEGRGHESGNILSPIFFPHFKIHVWPFIDDDFGIWQGTTLDIPASKFHAARWWSVNFDICRDNSGYSNCNCAASAPFYASLWSELCAPKPTWLR